MDDYRSTLLVILAGVQLLLVPAYRSTDFEVHRNWLAITHSLPIRKWYYDATSEWTLDYPPLFAWFERAMAPLAAAADAKMLSVSNLEYASPAAVLFQRVSVMATGLLLPAAAYYATRGGGGGGGGGGLKGQLLFFLLVANSGLLIVDNIHFQYNGILMGLMIFSLVLASERRYVASGALFAALLNMKHLFAYMAPVYFVYLLRNYCLGGDMIDGSGGKQGGRGGGGRGAAAAPAPLGAAAARLALLGGAVAAVFAASLGPFLAMGQLPQLLSRLFPFGRGLCHTYWAPNAWALYSFADKLLAAALAAAGLRDKPLAHMAGGVVGTTTFAVLPQVGPKAAAAAVLLSLAPCLAALWRRPGRGALGAAVAYANLCGFVWGYHVHEKAIITVTIPLALLAVERRAFAVDFLLLASAGHAALFPLLFGWAEAPVKWLLVAVYFAVAAEGLSRLHGGGGGGGGGRGGGGSWLPAWCRWYMWGLVPLELYCGLGHRLLLGGRLPFAPLMLTSVYCAAAPVWVWGRMAAWYARGCPEQA
ncbi:MAG: glycosyl transferase [Monoraphidium minutum]|nr:MAG: glycosyl transferase [Monoraphidium minutum]